MNTSQSQDLATAKPESHAAPVPRRGSPLRLGILLLVLAACIGALVYDYQVAKPGSESANLKIQKLIQARNQMSVKAAGPVTSADIQKELGRAPTWVQEEPTHTIEWYCWWGPTPLLSTRRHYITVLYVGEKRRFSSQQLNGPPAEDDLPGHFVTPSNVGPLEQPAGALPSGGPPPGAEAGAGPGMPGLAPPGTGKGSGKGKKGKGRPAESPPADAEAKPPADGSDPPAADKPAAEGEKPVESDKSGEKPADDKPDADKPPVDQPKAE